MLEGLEISVLNLKGIEKNNDSFRIDSEYFKKEYLDFFNSVKNVKPLKQFVKNGYRVVYENTKVLPKEEGIKNGYPIFLQATDIQTPFINTDDLCYVHEADWDRYKKGRIKKGEILIEVKGKAEKVAIVPDDFPQKVLVTGSLYKLSVNKRINKYFLLVYLVSKYGEAFKNRFKSNLLVSFINKKDLFRIPIPKLDKKFQEKIGNILKTTFYLNKMRLSSYNDANSVLRQDINVNGFNYSSNNINVKSSSDSFQTSGRLDSEYYLPMYESYNKFITECKNGASKINIVCHVKSEKYKPEDDRTYKYIELANIGSSGEITGCTQELGKNLPTRARRQVNTGDVIISSIEGSLESCAIIPEEYDGALCSTGFYVLKSDKINSETLLVLFKSELMQQILKRNCTGTILTSLNKKDFEKIKIPIIERNIQQIVKEKITESFSQRNQSKSLLETAKQAVEIAIEKNEEAAFAFIEEEVGDSVVV